MLIRCARTLKSSVSSTIIVNFGAPLTPQAFMALKSLSPTACFCCVMGFPWDRIDKLVRHAHHKWVSFRQQQTSCSNHLQSWEFLPQEVKQALWADGWCGREWCLDPMTQWVEVSILRVNKLGIAWEKASSTSRYTDINLWLFCC